MCATLRAPVSSTSYIGRAWVVCGRLRTVPRPTSKSTRYQDVAENITDIREYDVPYYLRVAIDENVRVGHWYTVKATHGKATMARHFNKVERAETVVLGKRPGRAGVRGTCGAGRSAAATAGVRHRVHLLAAFDIECTKQPLKFPDAKTDLIMMISYMIDKQVSLRTAPHRTAAWRSPGAGRTVR